MKAYVVDASVASRFLLVEDLCDKARLVLKGFLEDAVDLKAPELVTYEVGNALWKAVTRKLIGLNQASEKFSYFLKLKLNSIELTNSESVEALGWAAKNDVTYYDGAYVKASEKTGAVLLTADDNLYEKACEQIPALHLRDYE